MIFIWIDLGLEDATALDRIHVSIPILKIFACLLCGSQTLILFAIANAYSNVTNRLSSPLEPQRRKEPSVLPTLISLLQRLLHLLLRILSLTDLLECVIRYYTLQPFQLQCVPSRHDVVVVDHLDEWLDFRSLLHPLLAHLLCDF